ncbi:MULTISPECIES: NAD(P)/FAD-dependent oxidoreductase [Halomicrobium]|uniref:FAD dependent oxidoreductase n=2 Tax=Halomicrobium mukohataei TaxID=57705 RepID=C7NWU3_HALMD|nr:MULTISPECIES: FAD-dependent oxidoreductase [Halomicrobium]ACV48303.1 FAD dependent oxidoreductase [Halomicrobium mukohataei DSM 12286]QCD66720.1 FAD-dependent oxidoreductase [Halomicrobium mukohataei]QFR21526.1 FAD-dependent oxidoreductase [Halomicrobium sp. ZPS1]
MQRSVAVVGAGAAGAAAAYALREHPADVTVFEKSGGVCGRAATRRRNGCVYEYGANYLTADDDRVAELVTAELPSEGLTEIDEPVWTFDADREIREGRDEQTTRWTYEQGITQLAKRLFAAGDATVHRHTRVESLERSGAGWRVTDAEGGTYDSFDAVLLTPPGPQTADLLGQSEWEHADRRRLRQAAASVPYRTVVAGLLHYEFELDRPYYGLVSEAGDHDVGWIGREECKAGHVPDGETLLVVQMAPDWSVTHYRDDAATLTDAIADATATLLDDDRLAEPDWTDHQHWRYALPDDGVGADALETAAAHDLFLAGDWVAGEARLHAALRNGLRTGERIGEHL